MVNIVQETAKSYQKQPEKVGKFAEVNKTARRMVTIDIRQHNIKVVKQILEEKRGMKIFQKTTRPKKRSLNEGISKVILNIMEQKSMQWWKNSTKTCTISR